MNERSPATPPSASTPALPRILLVEDDPVSAAYLGDVAASLPAEVDVAGSIAEAVPIAIAHRHDLLLIDAHLPDGLGETLLQALREQGVDTPALAHTAASESAMHHGLLSAGFIAVLRKPLGVAEMRRALLRHLPQVAATSITPPTGEVLPCWDDDAAVAALGGQRTHVQALRGLFVDELPGQRQRITRACLEGNHAVVRDELHRLVASCGFVGAARVGQAVRVMQVHPLDAGALASLQDAIDEVLASA